MFHTTAELLFPGWLSLKLIIVISWYAFVLGKIEGGRSHVDLLIIILLVQKIT